MFNVIAKGEKAEVKISLIALVVIGKTKFSKQTVKGINLSTLPCLKKSDFVEDK